VARPLRLGRGCTPLAASVVGGAVTGALALSASGAGISPPGLLVLLGGYLVGALVGIATYRPTPMRVRCDGQYREGPHLIVVAANGTHFGNGMHVAPNAKLDDGALDVVIGGDLGRGESLVALAKLYRGTHVDGKKVLSFRAPTLDVEFDAPLPMELDGEAVRASSLHVRVLPRSLTVLGR
jgi:diacylglycerol kinase (ATP)